MQEKIPPLDAPWRADLDQSSGTARIVAHAAVAETGLIEMQDSDRQR
jgi:hypothetical protein